MYIACTSEMVPGRTFTEKAELLRKWGCDGMSVFADYATFTDETLSELKSLKDRTGITPCEFLFMSPDAGALMSGDKVKANATKALYKRAAAVCAELGAVTEIEYLYGAQDPLPLFDIYRQMDNEQEASFLAVYREIAEVVSGSSAYVLLEGINRYESPFMNSLLDCKRIVDKMGMTETGVLADFFHMSIEEDDIPACISAMGDSIKHVHLGDNNRKMPGLGTLDWERCLKPLKNIGYNGFLNFECSTMGKPESAIPQAVEFIKGILAR